MAFTVQGSCRGRTLLQRSPKMAKIVPPLPEAGGISFSVVLRDDILSGIHAEFTKRFNQRARQSASLAISHPLLDVRNAFGMSWPGNVFVRRSSGLAAVPARPERRPF